jgi:Mrp family chromosome partitioning ATPase
LWFVPALGKNAGDGKMTSVHSYLGEVRREFEYSIVEAPSAGESNEVTAMAQFADGIILVLSANKTRRATARKIKETLETAQARLLGTVLSDRVFPIPDAIYRRL